MAIPGQLGEYWTHGKGAIKIRWGTPGDFKRCVRAIRKYFRRNPEGLCNRLHVRALGVAPGQEAALEELEFTLSDLLDGDVTEPESLTAHAGEHSDDITQDEPEKVMVKTWSGLIAPIDKKTGDNRRFAKASLSNRELPLPLLWQQETTEGHKQSVVIGRINEVDHREDGTYGAGDFLDFDVFPDAQKAYELLKAGVIGPSVDLDDITFEMRNADGSEFSETEYMTAEGNGDKPAKPEFVITQGRISATTLVAVPAFAEVKLELSEYAAVEEDFGDCEDCDEQGEGLTASAGWSAPSATFFDDPALTALTGPTIADDGRRVYGHLAEWGVCHVGIPGACVTAPQSQAQYAYFHTGEMMTAEGDRVSVGRLILGAKHADPTFAYRESMKHYDETGRVVAYVRAYEDDYGIAFAGVLAPGVDEETLVAFAGCPLSGDWRRIGGHLELTTAISVGSPGFPVARMANDRQLALVAAGSFYAPEVDPAEALRQMVRAEMRFAAELDGELGTWDIIMGAEAEELLAGITEG